MTVPTLAELIREVLAEELARLREDVREERVRIANDADLAAFARRLLAMADDRGTREAFENGRLVFRLDGGAEGAGSAGSVSNAGGTGNAVTGAGAGGAGGGRIRGVHGAAARGASSARGASTQGLVGHTEAIDRGLLSERHVDRLSPGTTTVRIGPRVRMTPLARDRLRRRGIAIERSD